MSNQRMEKCEVIVKINGAPVYQFQANERMEAGVRLPDAGWLESILAALDMAKEYPERIHAELQPADEATSHGR